MSRFSSAIIGIALTLIGSQASAQFNIDIEKAPFNYSETPDNNRVSRLITKIDNKEVKLEPTPNRGYLESLLAALEIPESSQTLVFSKTSMQVRYISRHNPRAIYFNDDTYLGWVNGSSLVEISTVDPMLGAAFYTVDMAPSRPKMRRANYDCLACHATSMTQGIPGHTVRSVMPAYDGSIKSQLRSFITSDQSPLSERWGGWYVTGLHGDMKHLGNAYIRSGVIDTSNNANRKNVRDEIDSSNYLSPYSDIVALMVLEHQTQTHNAMVRANFFTRKLLHDAALASTDENESKAQLASFAQAVVERLLFCGEAKLTDEIRGSVLFADDFQSAGPRDLQGRSLRDLEMKTRMFRYPCSYLIHGDSFAALEPSLRHEIVRQVKSILGENEPSEPFAHLTADDRTNILAILSETHPDF